MLWRIGLAALAAWFGAGCAPRPLTPAPTLPPPAVALATQTPPPTPTATATSEPTATPTDTPEPSPTPQPATPTTAALRVQAASQLVGTAASASLAVQPSPVAPPTQVAATATAAAAPPAAAASAAEFYMVELVNVQRQAAGLAPLVADPTLMSVARARAADMVARGYTGHYDPVTGASLARPAMQAAGFNSSYLGENWYGSGRDLPGAVDVAMNWFMGDSPHRNNILGPNYAYLGVGIAYNGQLWLMVQNFAGANP
jgi:uncharacterized protein YkwD